jgi:hypothetical protein
VQRKNPRRRFRGGFSRVAYWPLSFAFWFSSVAVGEGVVDVSCVGDADELVDEGLLDDDAELLESNGDVLDGLAIDEVLDDDVSLDDAVEAVDVGGVVADDIGDVGVEDDDEDGGVLEGGGITAVSRWHPAAPSVRATATKRESLRCVMD